MPQEARDDGDRLTGVIEQFDREVSRALPATATHPHRGLPRIADPPIVEHPPGGQASRYQLHTTNCPHKN